MSDDREPTGDREPTVADVGPDAEPEEDSDPFEVLESDPFEEGENAPPTGVDVDDLDGEPVGADADPFERMEVGDLDGDVWDALSDGIADTEGGDDAVEWDAIGDEAADRREGERDGDPVREDALVDKREYCQRCSYFSEPPTVDCGHDGTAIVEVVSIERFRVRGCPMIAKEGPEFDATN